MTTLTENGGPENNKVETRAQRLRRAFEEYREACENWKAMRSW
jgi:hypothetical protein